MKTVCALLFRFKWRSLRATGFFVAGLVLLLPARAQTAGTGAINGTVIYRLTEVWGLRAGYNFYWLTNAALAPNQWDFATNTGAGTGVNDNGGLFLQGANLGVEARW